MKIITAESGNQVRIFNKLQLRKSSLSTWQTTENGHSEIVSSKIVYYDLKTQEVHAEINKLTSFDSELPIYFYVDEVHLIFKASVKGIHGQIVQVHWPSEIKLLNQDDLVILKQYLDAKHPELRVMKESFNTGIMREDSLSRRSIRDRDFLKEELNTLTLDEEDYLFADKRESPRLRPKVEKWIKIKKKGSLTEEVRLFDLSQGGLSFVARGPSPYPNGTELLILSFDEFVLDEPLVGTVVTQRPGDEINDERKIGVRFEDI